MWISKNPGSDALRRAVVGIAFTACLFAQQEKLASLYQEAQQAVASGNQGLAAEKYEQIVKLAPSIAEAFANLGNAYYSIGKTGQAAAAFRRAAKLKPQLTGPHFFLGVMAFNEHSYETAAKHFASAEKLEPANPLVRAYLGYTDYGLGRYDEAARHLEVAAAGGADPDILYHLSKTYGQLAKKAYGDLHVRFAGSLYDDLAQAHAHEAAHEWEAAAESYQRLSKRMPDNAALRRRLESASAKTANAPPVDAAGNDEIVDASLSLLEAPPSGEKLADRYQELASRVPAFSNTPPSAEAAYRAAETFQSLAYLASLRVLEEDASSCRAHQLKGESLEAAGGNDEAIAEYQKALQAKPELPTLHFAIANIYWKTNRLAQASPELRSELQVDPNNAQALYELGDVLADSGNSVEAERYFLKALQLQPRMPEPHLSLEKIYSARADYPKALQHLQAASTLDPLNSTPHYRMAGIYRKLGRAADAEKEMALFEHLKSAEKR